MEKKSRYGYLDLLKLIAMVMVCMYHFSWIQHTGYVRPFPLKTLVLRYFRGFDAVCVPLFMMVNGALLLNGKSRVPPINITLPRHFIELGVVHIVDLVPFSQNPRALGRLRKQ